MGISPADFEKIQERLRGKKQPAGKNAPNRSRESPPSGPRRILGVDPSLRATGYGVISVENGTPALLTLGTLKCPPKWLRSRCLGHIAGSLRQVIREFQPEVCAFEALFFAQNQRTTMILGEARGAALATVAEAGLSVHELAPRKVKLAIVGFGGAQKFAVARMVQRMLNLAELPSPDAADALAVALVFAQESKSTVFAPLKQI